MEPMPVAIADSHTRVKITNALEVDEQIEFALLGKSESSLVGTDQRIFVADPVGRRKRSRSLHSLYYSELENVHLEQRGNNIILHTIAASNVSTIPSVTLESDEQLSLVVKLVPEIRRRILMAKYAEVESSPDLFADHNPIILSLDDMLSMDPTEFEVFTGKALTALGYTNVSRVGGAGDLAADLVTRDPQGRSAIVQCKRYTPGSKVGSPTLQSFIGMKQVHHKADRGIFVTTADYSQQAIDLAKQHDIVLINGDDLVKIAALVLTESSSPGTVSSIGVHNTNRLFCNQCGTALAHATRFCPQCGRSVMESQTSHDDRATQLNT